MIGLDHSLQNIIANDVFNYYTYLDMLKGT
jgi:hypothetical protein